MKTAREAARLSQQDLADHAGVDVRTIRNLEHGTGRTLSRPGFTWMRPALRTGSRCRAPGRMRRRFAIRCPWQSLRAWSRAALAAKVSTCMRSGQAMARARRAWSSTCAIGGRSLICVCACSTSARRWSMPRIATRPMRSSPVASRALRWWETFWIFDGSPCCRIAPRAARASGFTRCSAAPGKT
ncbi:MAG: helix-turn-helix domain-containing protein [Myxococcales bacterium]|nr:helix-turn-helix domain-containing protein [Myxococcales bacterium]